MIYVICVAALVLAAYQGHTQVANILIKANWKR